MGSYMSIANSTDQTYACKVGIHESLLSSVFGIFAGFSMGLAILGVIGVIGLLAVKLVMPVPANAIGAATIVTALPAIGSAGWLYSAHFVNAL